MTSVAAQAFDDEVVCLKALTPLLRAELQRVAHWWAHNSIDQAAGGFHGTIGNDGTAVIGGAKNIILNTRILWFMSTYAQYAGDEDFRALADRARDYLLLAFQDRENGGVIWEVDAHGRAVNSRKQAYAQAFAIYALAAHYNLTADQKSLSAALCLFETVEARFWDDTHGGYWEAMACDWSPIEDMRLSEVDLPAPKSMNTHLHLLEAYTELFKVSKRRDVGRALTRLVDLHLDRIYRPELGHLRLFWDAEWRDMSETISFGHDIEASWLISDAVECLGQDDLRTRARPVILALAEGCLEEGMGRHGDMGNERRLRDGNLDETRVWWVQAEALVGFLNAYEMTGDERFAVQAQGLWQFIEAHVIDRDGGEWLWHSRLDKEHTNPYAAGPWKACYHNGRALMEALRRIETL